MKIQLVDNFERISKRYSVKLIKIGAGLSAGWLALTAIGMTNMVPPIVSQIVTTGIFIGAFVAAYLHQTGLTPEDKEIDDETDATKE